jgi:hypothetical protein
VKKIASAFLLSVVLFNTAGFYLYCAFKVYRIHEEMRATLKSLPDNELQVVIRSMSDFDEMVGDEDEIRIDDRMFDIAKIEFSEQGVKLYGKYDDQESDLLSLAKKVLISPVSKNGSMPDCVLDFITLAFIVPQNSVNLNRIHFVLKPTTYYQMSVGFFEPAAEFPPPEELC